MENEPAQHVRVRSSDNAIFYGVIAALVLMVVLLTAYSIKVSHELETLKDDFVELQKNYTDLEQNAAALEETMRAELQDIIAEKDQVIVELTQRVEKATTSDQTSDTVVEIQSALEQNTADDQIIVRTPNTSTVWCRGATQPIQWEAPDRWDVVKILLQDISGGNRAIATMPAQDGVHVWTVGEWTTYGTGQTQMVESGQYEIIIAPQNESYEDFHQSSETFSIVNC